MTLTVTLNDIRAHDPCRYSWRKLLDSLGKTQADDTPVPLRYIHGLLGLDDALWALRALPEQYDGPIRLLTCDFAESLLHLTDDPRPAEAIRVARAYAVGQATDAELDAAAAAAWAAACTAARAAARAAAEAAWAAADAAAEAAARPARAAARAAAWAAAGPAVKAASWAAKGTTIDTGAIFLRWLDQFDETE